jgi:hypothetical protein
MISPPQDYMKSELARIITQPRAEWNVESVANSEKWTAALPIIPTLLNRFSQSIPSNTDMYLEVEVKAQDISFNKQSNIYAGEQSLELKFKFLTKQWREEIGAESSLSRITGNVNYLKVISLGTAVIPLILKELQKEPAPWFVALRALTEEENVGREYTGNFRKMAGEWIRWGRENNYI